MERANLPILRRLWRKWISLGVCLKSRIGFQLSNHDESPDAENQSTDAPCKGSPAAVRRNNRTKNRVEAVNQCDRAVKRGYFHIGLNKEKTGEITEEMIQIHQ